jgi:hypothetical protein
MEAIAGRGFLGENSAAVLIGASNTWTAGGPFLFQATPDVI